MVSALDSGATPSGPGLSPGRGHCGVLLGSWSLSPPRCINGNGEFNAGGNPGMD